MVDEMSTVEARDREPRRLHMDLNEGQGVNTYSYHAAAKARGHRHNYQLLWVTTVTTGNPDSVSDEQCTPNKFTTEISGVPLNHDSSLYWKDVEAVKKDLMHMHK
jgi:hypothetical protein